MNGGRVHFLLQARSRDLGVAPPIGQRASFKRGDVEVALEIESTGGSETSSCLVTAATAREVSADVYALLEEFQSLNTDSIEALSTDAWGEPRESDLASIRFHTKVLSGRELNWLVDPPQDVVAICEDVFAELEGEAARLVGLMRWLFNRPGPARPLSDARHRWSFTGEDWTPAPTALVDVPVFGGDEVELSEQGIDLLARIWEAGETAEPLARQILLEAVALADENERAALVLAVAAAEVGVKRFAAESTRESEAWLISTLQSPPLYRLLRDYLPFCTEQRTTDGRVIPKHILTTIHTGVEARNDVVHRGYTAFTTAELAEVLVAVNDLLYLLDWFRGNGWALRHVEARTREAYGS